MKLSEFRARLRAYPDAHVVIVLPNGNTVPRHYHVTEVGHIAKNFVDCGGRFSASESCVLQTWMASDRDDGHRLTAAKLDTILGFADSILPSDDLPVEVEYEEGVMSQYPAEEVTYSNSELTIQLGLKHTACLARDRCDKAKEACASATELQESCCAGTERCC